MRKFNDFIYQANLLEVPLCNGRFPWSCEGSSVARSLLDFSSLKVGMRSLIAQGLIDSQGVVLLMVGWICS